MPNEIKKFPHALSINAEQLSNMQRKSISPSSTTAFIWTISGILLVACSSGNDGGDGLLDPSGVISADDEELRGTLGNAERELENGIGAFGEIEVDSGGLQTEWIYTPDERAQVLSEGESVTEKFTFTGGDGVDDVVITITVVGVNDAPEIGTPLGIQRGTVDQDININVNNLFTDIDRSDELTLTFT